MVVVRRKIKGRPAHVNGDRERGWTSGSRSTGLFRYQSDIVNPRLSLSLHSHVSNNYARPTSYIQVQRPSQPQTFLRHPAVEHQNDERSFSLSDRDTLSLPKFPLQSGPNHSEATDCGVVTKFPASTAKATSDLRQKALPARKVFQAFPRRTCVGQRPVV